MSNAPRMVSPLPSKKEKCWVFRDQRDHFLLGRSRRHDERSQPSLRGGYDFDRQRQERARAVIHGSDRKGYPRERGDGESSRVATSKGPQMPGTRF